MASFDVAQSQVKEVEAGYSDDRKDTGNWIEIKGIGKRFIGTNHGISAPIFFYNILIFLLMVDIHLYLSLDAR